MHIKGEGMLSVNDKTHNIWDKITVIVDPRVLTFCNDITSLARLQAFAIFDELDNSVRQSRREQRNEQSKSKDP